MVWDGSNLHGFNASGRSPQAWNRAHFNNYKTMPLTGWDSVTIPGAVSSWITLSKQFGRLEFSKLFTTAINYAERGFLVSPITAENWQTGANAFKNNKGFAKVFYLKGVLLMPVNYFKHLFMQKLSNKLLQLMVQHFIMVL